MSAAKLQFPGFKESKLGDSVAKLGAAPATPSTTALGFIPLTKDTPTEPAANSSTTKSDSSNAEVKSTDNGSGSTASAPTSSASVSATASSSTSSSSSSSSFVF